MESAWPIVLILVFIVIVYITFAAVRKVWPFHKDEDKQDTKPAASKPGVAKADSKAGDKATDAKAGDKTAAAKAVVKTWTVPAVEISGVDASCVKGRFDPCTSVVEISTEGSGCAVGRYKGVDVWFVRVLKDDFVTGTVFGDSVQFCDPNVEGSVCSKCSVAQKAVQESYLVECVRGDVSHVGCKATCVSKLRRQGLVDPEKNDPAELGACIQHCLGTPCYYKYCQKRLRSGGVWGCPVFQTAWYKAHPNTYFEASKSFPNWCSIGTGSDCRGVQQLLWVTKNKGDAAHPCPVGHAQDGGVVYFKRLVVAAGSCPVFEKGNGYERDVVKVVPEAHLPWVIPFNLKPTYCQIQQCQQTLQNEGWSIDLNSNVRMWQSEGVQQFKKKEPALFEVIQKCLTSVKC